MKHNHMKLWSAFFSFILACALCIKIHMHWGKENDHKCPTSVILTYRCCRERVCTGKRGMRLAWQKYFFSHCHCLKSNTVLHIVLALNKIVACHIGDGFTECYAASYQFIHIMWANCRFMQSICVLLACLGVVTHYKPGNFANIKFHTN